MSLFLETIKINIAGSDLLATAFRSLHPGRMTNGNWKNEEERANQNYYNFFNDWK